jgi:hypothetical protein
MATSLSQPDPNVKLPPAVLALAAAAAARQEAYIQELASGEQPEGEQPPLEQPLRDGGTVQPTPPTAPPVDEPELPFEEESYKQKFLSAQGRLEKATSRIGEMSEQIASLKADYEMKFGRLEQQVKGVNGFVHQNVRDSLETTMDRDVPNWRDINYQPEFLDWLKLPDPYSGGIRMNMLKAAYDQNDTARVRAFFKGFLAEEAATTPAGYQPDRNPQPAAGGTGKIPLESLAAPGRAKSAAANGAPTEKPVFTRAQITQFYLDKTNGRFRGRETEATRIEQQIFEAQNEGRIR